MIHMKCYYWNLYAIAEMIIRDVGVERWCNIRGGEYIWNEQRYLQLLVSRKCDVDEDHGVRCLLILLPSSSSVNKLKSYQNEGKTIYANPEIHQEMMLHTEKDKTFWIRIWHKMS